MKKEEREKETGKRLKHANLWLNSFGLVTILLKPLLSNGVCSALVADCCFHSPQQPKWLYLGVLTNS